MDAVKPECWSQIRWNELVMAYEKYNENATVFGERRRMGPGKVIALAKTRIY